MKGKGMRYPKVVTVTCAECEKEFDIRLDHHGEKRPRYYCRERCRLDYRHDSNNHAKANKDWKPKVSRVVREQAINVSDLVVSKQDAILAEKRKKQYDSREAEYWEKLRAAKGIRP